MGGAEEHLVIDTADGEPSYVVYGARCENCGRGPYTLKIAKGMLAPTNRGCMGGRCPYCETYMVYSDPTTSIENVPEDGWGAAR